MAEVVQLQIESGHFKTVRGLLHSWTAATKLLLARVESRDGYNDAQRFTAVEYAIGSKQFNESVPCRIFQRRHRPTS